MAEDYGVAVMVPQGIWDESLRLNQFLVGIRVPLVYSLASKGDFIPHITLYQGRFASREVALRAWKELCKEIPKLLKRPVRVRMTRDIELRKNGNIFWNVRRTAELEHFHMEFASRMQAHTGGLLMDQSREVLKGGDPDAATRVIRYGAVASGAAYHPHITLARLRHLKHEVVLGGLNPMEMEFAIDKICFGPINEFGQMSSKSIDVFNPLA